MKFEFKFLSTNVLSHLKEEQTKFSVKYCDRVLFKNAQLHMSRVLFDFAGFVGIVLKIHDPASTFWYILFAIFVTYAMLPMPLW